MPADPPGQAPGTTPAFVTAILRVPLFAKLLVVDAIVAVSAVLAGAWVARRLAGQPLALLTEGRLLLCAAIAAVITIGVNAVIVRVALRPVRLLEATAARVAGGDLAVRAPASVFADRDFDRVVRTFNEALEAAEAQRLRTRAMASRSVHATEAERKRTASTLQDGVAQTLAALRLRLRLAARVRDPDVQRSEIEVVGAELAEAIEELRGVALALRPPALDVMGLGAAVETLARSVGREGQMRVEVQAEVGDRRVESAADLALYRILQEALSNVLRHANAATVRVRLRKRADGVAELTVEDDGCGFAWPEGNGESVALGLLSMQERAAYVGGRVQIASTPGGGTRITAEIPLEARQAEATAQPAHA